MSKKSFLSIVFVISAFVFFSPSITKAGDCEDQGSTCTTQANCSAINASYNYACASNQVCCSTLNSTTSSTASGYQEGSTGGFLFLKGHIVPCGRSTDDPGTANNETASCTLCHIFLMFKNIFDLLFSLVIVAAILFITIGGVVYTVSAGNSSLVSTAKSIIKSTLIGFALMIGGWLIVYTLLTFLSTGDMVGKGSNSWFEFECDTTSSF